MGARQLAESDYWAYNYSLSKVWAFSCKVDGRHVILLLAAEEIESV